MGALSAMQPDGYVLLRDYAVGDFAQVSCVEQSDIYFLSFTSVRVVYMFRLYRIALSFLYCVPRDVFLLVCLKWNFLK